MRDDILEIGIDDKERLFIKPNKERFDLIYRTATEVHWDDKEVFLYSPKPREWTYFDWFRHIVSVVETECDCNLALTKKTIWTNIPEQLKKQIMGHYADKTQKQSQASTNNPVIDNNSSAKWVVRLFWIVCMLLVFQVYNNMTQISMLERISIGRGVSAGEIATNEQAQITLLLGVLFSMIISTVVFLIWFHKAYLNLQHVGFHSAYRPSMAIWGFIIPFVNLILPYLVAKEIVDKTAMKLLEKNPGYALASSKGLILLWWCTYLLSSVIGWIGAIQTLGAETPEAMIAATWANIISLVAVLIAAAVTMSMVRRMSRDEYELIRVLGR